MIEVKQCGNKIEKLVDLAHYQRQRTINALLDDCLIVESMFECKPAR